MLISLWDCKRAISRSCCRAAAFGIPQKDMDEAAINMTRETEESTVVDRSKTSRVNI